jgi:asparagine synthase (glutamine-hydrolysing)
LEPIERHLVWFGAFSATEQASLFRPETLPPIVSEHLLDVAREAAAPALATGDPVDALLRLDLLLHLPEALLAKVDRATMLVSLEARAPYLERTLVETAMRLPAAWKVRRVSTKRVLRRALADVVPPAVLKRRKRGFAVPTGRSLAGFLGDRLRDRLSSGRIARDFLDPRVPLALLDQHRAGLADHSRKLYPLLALLEFGENALAPRAPAALSGPRVA